MAGAGGRRLRHPSVSRASLARWVVAALVVAGGCWRESSAQEYCEVHDYERQSSVCTGTTRLVKYNKVRECQDPFPGIIEEAHSEACGCAPEDYDIVYEFEGEGAEKKCIMHYVPRNATLPDAAGAVPTAQPSCESSATTKKLQVDEAYCELNNIPCREENMLVTYSECYYSNNRELGDRTIGGIPAFEVIYFFDSNCNPNNKRSIRLPPNKLMPCATKCGLGSVLLKGNCTQCPAGTFSNGGALRYEKFYTEPTKEEGFEYFCTYTNSTGTFGCENWHVEADTLAVGPFNEPNTWYQDECASDPAYDCYNNLKAMLRMTVKLKRAGQVKFKYTVSAEKGFDGLSFYVDVEEQPALPLQSSQLEPAEAAFPLTEGYHTLTWVYSKDEKWTAGSDTASIRDLEIDGVEFNEVACRPCAAGFRSGPGASECEPCPLNFISGYNSSECESCHENQYSLNIPRIKCFDRKPCDPATDLGITYGACDATTNQRLKSFHWLEPHICSGTLPAAEPETCPPCPPGQFPVTEGNTKSCQFCPPGTVRDDTAAPGEQPPSECSKCEAGFVAMKELNLAHLSLEPEQQLPAQFATGCSQGDCSATKAWRMVGGALSSGFHEATSVAAWLKMNVSLEMIGEVSFNFSVDIPKGDTSRGFFFYVDDTPIDEMVDNGEGSIPVSSDPTMSGPWQLEKGEHTLMWKWVKANSTTPASRDTALIYDIKIRGTTTGGATSCERVPDGAELTESGSSWEECPKGYYSDGGGSKCAKCPANTFNPYTFGGKWACLPCGAGTTSLEGSTECEIGDVNEPTTFCQYAFPTAANSSLLVGYNLAPLSRLHPGRMFGPVYQDPSSPEGDGGPLYYVSVCDKFITNHTCFDNAHKPLNTSLCRVNPKSSVNKKFRPAHSLGDRVALQPLGSDARLERRGFNMVLNGERCFGNQMETNTTISFICDPSAGYGQPHAWTVKGLAAAFNPDLPFPQWVDRTASTVVPIGTQSTCSYQMVWYSAFACPMCTKDDYEAVEVSGCVNNTYITYKYKQPQTCQPDPEEPLPPNVPCKPCTAEEYERYEDACADERGVHNVTYQWVHPKLCDDTSDGAARLPEDVLAGPCVPTVYLESSDLLKPQYLALLVLGAVAIVALAITSLVTWLKSRKIYAMYSKLVISDEGGEEGDFGAHEEEMEEVERHHEGSRLNPNGEDSAGVVADPTEYRREEDRD